MTVNKMLIPVFGGLLIMLAAQKVLADDVPNTSLQMSSLIKNLQTKGYGTIHKIKFKDGVYKVKTVNARGQEVKVHINPQTGAIMTSTGNKGGVTMLDAIKKVEAAGYRNIYEVEADDDKYEIKALDKQGKKTELEINTSSGEISKEESD